MIFVLAILLVAVNVVGARSTLSAKNSEYFDVVFSLDEYVVQLPKLVILHNIWLSLCHSMPPPKNQELKGTITLRIDLASL